MSQLIAFTGKARSGKDASADVLCENYRFDRASFARAMKDGIKVMIGLDEEQVNGDLKEEPVGFGNLTPRDILQTLGTEWGREMIHPDIWIVKVAQQWEKFKLQGRDMVITDLRFENEAEWVRSIGGTVVHIKASNSTEIKNNDHISESGIVVHSRDKIIVNDKSAGIKSLIGKIDWLIRSIKNLHKNESVSIREDLEEPTSTILSLQHLITSWADEVMPQRTITNALTKLVMEEIPEYLTSQHDPMELADCAILIYDIAHLAGIDLEKAMRDKMEINKNRTWAIDDETGLLNHVEKSVDESKHKCCEGKDAPHCECHASPNYFKERGEIG